MRADLQKALDNAKTKNLINPLGFKTQIKMLESQLSDDEQIIELISANANLITKNEKLEVKPFTLTNKKPGIFIITSKRVIHVSKILFNESIEQIMLKDINNVEYKTSIVVATLRIQSLTNVLEIDLKKEVAQKYISLINELINSATQTKNSTSKIDTPDQIKKLAELRDQGILTEEEFQKKKEKLLNSI